jgi:hypothetical protein
VAGSSHFGAGSLGWGEPEKYWGGEIVLAGIVG